MMIDPSDDIKIFLGFEIIQLFMFTSVACTIVGPSLTTFSTDFSFQNLSFFGNLLEFSAGRNHLKINISHILNPNLTKLNSIKSSCSSRSFQQYQRHIPIPPKFSATI
jgi:hypothetical protein